MLHGSLHDCARNRPVTSKGSQPGSAGCAEQLGFRLLCRGEGLGFGCGFMLSVCPHSCAPLCAISSLPIRAGIRALALFVPRAGCHPRDPSPEELSSRSPAGDG